MPYSAAIYRALPDLTLGAPENLLIFGESGGSGRPNNNGVVGQCDPLAEREH